MIEIFEQKLCMAPSDLVYEWILDVPSYKTWLPFCSDSGVLAIFEENTHEAFITMRLGPLQERLITRNTCVQNKEVTIELIHGPFKTFSGKWTLVPQGERETLVTLKISAEMKLRFLEPAINLAIAQDRGRVLGLLQRRFLVQ